MSKSSLIVIALFLVAAAAAVFVWLPADAFFSSDEGVKFIQLESLARNGFRDARLVWPGEALGLERRYAVVERFFELRGGDLYSPHPLLLALASAPAWLVAGFRGLYVLPLLAGAAAVALTMALGRAFGVRRPWLAGAIVAFASPLFFYSLCYWEHTLAVALWLGGFALLLKRSPTRLVVAGALWGVGAALRPEFYWLAACTVAALFIFNKGERVRTAAWPLAAFAVTAVGLELLMQAVWGQPAFMRFGANLAYGTPRGPAAFVYGVGHSLIPISPWPLGVGTAVVLLFGLIGWKWRPAVYIAACVAALLVLAYAQFFHGYATALAAAFPAAFGLVFLARGEVRRAFGGMTPIEKSFYAAVAAFALTLFVVVPDTSGYAWGPRFLLYVVPAAAVALARELGANEGRGRVPRLVFVYAFVAMSAAMQLFGLARLAATKDVHRGLVADLASRPAGPVLTNDWYLATYAAPSYSERPFVLATAEGDLGDLAAALAARRVRHAYFASEGPTPQAEREYYVLGMTTTLASDFNVADVGLAEGSGAPGCIIPPWYVWSLEIPPHLPGTDLAY